jgi:hypothetical protein
MNQIFKSILGVSALTLGVWALDKPGSLTISEPISGLTTYKSETVTFNWTAVTGASKYYYVCDTNSSTVPKDSASKLQTTGTSGSCSLSSSGSWYVHVQAFDGTSEYSLTTRNASALSVDADAGTVTMSPSGGSITTDTNSITLSGSETGSIYFTVDGSTPTTSSTKYTTPLTLGVSATVKALLVDSAGNSGVVNSKDFTITNNPTIKTAAGATISGQTIATSTANGATAVTALDVNGTDLTRYQYKIDDASTYTTVGSLDTNIDISSLDTGSHTVYVKGGDAYNFQTTATSTTFIVDNTPPSNQKILVNGVEAVESNSSTVTFADNFTFTLSSSDGTIRYTTDGTTPSKTVGTVYSSSVTTAKTVTTGNTATFPIQMISYDSAGNKAAVKSINFTIDKKSPVLTMPTTQIFSSSFDVSISSDDSTATIYYLISDSATTTVSALKTNGVTVNGSSATATVGKNPSTNQDDSTYKYLHAIAVDNVGNGDEITDIETVTFTYNGNTKILSADSIVNIGNSSIGSSVSKVITITNSGTESITLTDANISVSGTDFNRTSTTCAKTLSSDATCSVTVSFTPTSTGSKEGVLSIIYDGTNSNELNVTLTGTVANSAPNATYASDINTSEDTNGTTILTGTDPENDDLSYYIGSTGFNGTVTIETNGSTVVSPVTNFNGTGWFTYYVSDGENNSSEQNVTINVSAVNDAPVINNTFTPLRYTVGAAQTTYYDINATDVDDTNITIDANSSNSECSRYKCYCNYNYRCKWYGYDYNCCKG